MLMLTRIPWSPLPLLLVVIFSVIAAGLFVGCIGAGQHTVTLSLPARGHEAGHTLRRRGISIGRRLFIDFPADAGRDFAIAIAAG